MNTTAAPDWTPAISPELARKWLNVDAYRKTGVVDPAALPDLDPPAVAPPAGSAAYDPALLRLYPLTDQAGHPRRSRLRDPQQPDWRELSLLETLVAGLHDLAAQGNWREVRAQMDQISRLRAALPRPNPTADCLLQAEVHLEFALAYRKLGERAQALELSLACLKEYQRGADPHAEALARWIAGYFCLELPQTHLAEGLAHWQAGWSAFARLGADPNQHNKTEAFWYQRRADLMRADLNQALQFGGIRARAAPPDAAPPPDASPPPAADPAPKSEREAPATEKAAAPKREPPAAFEYVGAGAHFAWGAVPLRVVQVARGGSAPGVVVEHLDGKLFEALGDLPASRTRFVNRADFEAYLTTGEWLPCDEPPPAPSLAETWLRLATPRIYAEVAAHPAGRLITERPSKLLAPRLECQVIVIDDQPYSLHSTQGRKTGPPRLIALQPEDSLIRVRGDSMNQALPVSIEDGDYVLVRPDPEPANGQIVVVRLDDDHGLNTVKRRRGAHFIAESTGVYPPIKLREARQIVGQVIGVAKPVRP